MRNLSQLILIFLPLCALAQQPDFELRNFYLLSGESFYSGEKDISASLKVFSDGENLTLVVQVRDDFVEIKRDAYQTDHLEFWLALPPASFPATYPYVTHPDFIINPGTANPEYRTTASGIPRLFTTFPEAGRRLTLENFLNGHDYPQTSRIENEKLSVPKPDNLKQSRLPLGIVHFAVYPDQRKAVLFNPETHKFLGKLLGLTPGDYSEGVRYVVDFSDDGYVYNIQLSPQALGIVQLPAMEEVRLAMDVIDKDYKGKAATTVLSISPFREPPYPATFTNIRFRKAFRTNFSGIPDAVFTRAGFFPLSVFTSDGWRTTTVETDVLLYGEQKLSSDLLEVCFFQPELRFDSILTGLSPYEVFTVEQPHVNGLPTRATHYFIGKEIFRSEQLKVRGKADIKDALFSFPDGTTGLVIKETTPVDPYGWGPCGDCMEETIRIIRVTQVSSRNLITIRQGSGSRNSCQIGDTHFDGFFVSQLDWLKEGKILVLRLDAWESLDKARVKVTWDSDGANVRLKFLP